MIQFSPAWYKPFVRCPVCRTLWLFGSRTLWGFFLHSELSSIPPFAFDPKEHLCLEEAVYNTARVASQQFGRAIEDGTAPLPEAIPEAVAMLDMLRRTPHQAGGGPFQAEPPTYFQRLSAFDVARANNFKPTREDVD